MKNESIKVLMIDNYDSFTFNLVHYLQNLDLDVIVRKNDDITLEQIKTISPSHIIISPGPCTPNEAGVSLELIENFKGKIPILGVCLGHQAIGQCFGANVIRAGQVMHGKTSIIHHTNEGVFTGLPQSFNATRYHSLVIDPSSLPEELSVTAWTTNEEGQLEAIMGVKHNRFKIEGIQFHPESILSEYGMELLNQFIKST